MVGGGVREVAKRTAAQTTEPAPELATPTRSTSDSPGGK